MCQHQPTCPPADAVDRDAAHVVVPHPEQGWSLLCNGIVLFDDTGALLPDGQSIPPHRRAAAQAPARPAQAVQGGGCVTAPAWPGFVPAPGRRVSR